MPVPVICHLKITSVAAPAPYDADHDFSVVPSPADADVEKEDSEVEVTDSGGIPDRLVAHPGGWPETTCAMCHWCCAPFDGPPVGIPVAAAPAGMPYRVVGNFCTLECAAAYNFSTKGDSAAAWERHGLINSMAVRMGLGDVHVTPAPPREILQHFGGPMSVADFRARNNTVVIVYPALMVAEPRHVEEVHACQVHRSVSFVPVDSERLDKYKIKLKRNKPRPGFMSTLDYCLGTGAGAATGTAA
jgi:hypothetical protein